MIHLLLSLHLLCSLSQTLDSAVHHQQKEKGCLLAVPDTQNLSAEYEAGDYLYYTDPHSSASILHLILDKEWIQDADALDFVIVSQTDSISFFHSLSDSVDTSASLPYLMRASYAIQGKTRIQGTIHYRNGSSTELFLAEGAVPLRHHVPHFPQNWQLNLQIR